MDLQTNNSPISPFVSGPEPQSQWPLYRRQGNCSDAYQGINVRWVTSEGRPLSIRRRSAPTAISPIR